MLKTSAEPKGSDVVWEAEWIWSAGALKQPFHVSYFRGAFVLEKAATAKIHCAADSKYRLWLNGTSVGLGPARGHPAHPYYDTHTVALPAGQSVIAVQVQHYTARCGLFASVRGGLICQVEIDGKTVAASDGSWRALSSKAYGCVPGFLFPERFDAREEPEGWEQPGFDASRWPKAKVVRGSELAPREDLLARPIPLLTETRRVPARLVDAWRCGGIARAKLAKEKDVATSLWETQQARKDAETIAGAWVPADGKPLKLDVAAGEACCLVLDFGLEMLAHPEITVQGAGGLIVDLGYSECLENDHVATLWQGVRQSERIILRQGRTRHRINQPRGFRFMILRVANVGERRRPVLLEDVAAYETIYPTERKGTLSCSDPLLGRIYDLSARTVNLCMEDGYTDCPWRERSQWVGDAQPETLFSYFCFGAYDLARKAVLEFTTGNTAEGWIPGVFPTGRPHNLPTWGMRVPVIAWEYYLYTGDGSVLPTIYEGVRKQMAWLARYEDRRGLLVNIPGWCFVDWTKLDDRHSGGAVQGWYLEALVCSERLARETGDGAGAKAFRAKAARLRKSLARHYWSPKRKAFLKYRPDSERRPEGVPDELVGQHENFLFSLLGVGTAAQRRQALDALAGATGRYLPNLGDYQSNFTRNGQFGNVACEDVIKIGSPFWSYYALLALMEAGRVEAAIEYMRLGWGLMLENGATSCWEMWDRHTSLCHGWSAAPAMVLPAYVLGVRPVRPGFATLEVRPHPGDLRWAKGSVPTPHGTVRVAWRVDEDRFSVKVTVPSDTSVRVRPPVCRGAKWRLDTGEATVGPGAHEVVFRTSTVE